MRTIQSFKAWRGARGRSVVAWVFAPSGEVVTAHERGVVGGIGTVADGTQTSYRDEAAAHVDAATRRDAHTAHLAEVLAAALIQVDVRGCSVTVDVWSEAAEA